MFGADGLWFIFSLIECQHVTYAKCDCISFINSEKQNGKNDDVLEIIYFWSHNCVAALFLERIHCICDSRNMWKFDREKKGRKINRDGSTQKKPIFPLSV